MAQVSNFQQLVIRLIDYWIDRGCIWSQPYDAPMGAGTFHPHTFLKGIGPEPWRSVYVQPCRRPIDGRYGESPYRFQHYYQLQVLLKPAPSDIVDVFLKSLESVGISLRDNDIGLLEDDWKGPTLGAWGLGWEVRANGQEISQFTYFQQLGGMDVDVVCGEITYGLERLFMYATGIKNGLDMPYNGVFSYGDVYRQNEFEFSHFNFNQADTKDLLQDFQKCEEEVSRLCALSLVLPAYDFVLRASHAFNLLDARGALSVSERQRFIGRVRDCARLCAEKYREEREKLGYPMMDRLSTDATLPIFETPVEVRREEEEESADQGVADLVVEFGVEEMPPAFQVAVLKRHAEVEAFRAQLIDLYRDSPEFCRCLQEAPAPELFVTQRRLVLYWPQLPAQTPRSQRPVWGPAARVALQEGDAPLAQRLTKAGEGFCRKNGVSTESVDVREKDGSLFLYAEREEGGEDLARTVVTWFESFLLGTQFPLKMRWLTEQGRLPFVRPVRWVLALHGARKVPYTSEAFGLVSGRKTQGQRIMGERNVVLSHAEGYKPWAREQGIQLSASQRERFLVDAAEAALMATGDEGFEIVENSRLLQTVSGLSETPFVFVGQFPAEYLALPDQLVKSVLRDHLNSFAVQDRDGNLQPHFVGVCNYRPRQIETMRRGVEEVVIGRLADGLFYFDSDLKGDPEALGEKLRRQVFQQGLGSLADKSERISDVASHLAMKFNDESLAKLAGIAGRFSKIDLQTGCVMEFPDEMQGVMGGVLLRRQKSFVERFEAETREQLAQGIEQHYLPTGASDALPSTALGCLVSLADKWDTVVALMLRGDRVKGNKDPFGLRRNALAVLRLSGAESGSVLPSLSLTDLFELAARIASGLKISFEDETREAVLEFMLGRLIALWRSFALSEAVSPVVALMRRSARQAMAAGSSDPGVKGADGPLTLSAGHRFVRALDGELRQEGSALTEALEVYKRCRNILSRAEAGEAGEAGDVNVALFLEPEERNLWDALIRASEEAERRFAAGDYVAYLGILAGLSGPMRSYFERVMVLADDPELQRNRLHTLRAVLSLFERYADFSEV